jgi:propionyl-CoA synthetase
VSYVGEYRRSLTDPEGFWADRARELPWFRFPERVLGQDEQGAWRWFQGGRTNTAWLALDRHVAAGRGDRIALIYDSPVTDTVERISYTALTERVARVAGALQRLGIDKGDRVIIYLPMVPEAAIAMLACARIGAVHSVVFGGFAPPELAARIDDAQPKVGAHRVLRHRVHQRHSLPAAGGRAIKLARHKPAHKVMLQRAQCPVDLAAGGYLDWHDWEAAADPVSWVEVEATDPLYILYTSGTTGKPKGVLRDHGGHAVALHYSMKAVYDIDPDDVFWAASDVGWVVGHSYIVYAPLIKGCTSVLYEGKPVRTPDAGAYWRVIHDHRVKSFFVAPTAFRAIRKEDPDCRLKDRYDLSSLRIPVRCRRAPRSAHLSLAARAPADSRDRSLVADRDRLVDLRQHGRRRTAGNQARLADAAGAGLRPAHLDESGQELGPGKEGAVVIKGPLPPGSLPTVWGDHQRYLEAYWSQFPGFYFTGDEGYRDEDGYVYIMGRMDDVINVAGHRLSTGEMEEVLAAHPAVAECAVIGIADAGQGAGAAGVAAAEGRHQRRSRRPRARAGAHGARAGGRVRQLQARGGGEAIAEDAFRQDSAADRAPHGGRQAVHHALDHR